MIERQIIIGLIVSDEYVKKVQHIWKSEYIESSIAKLISDWVFSYYNKYEKAPNRNIEQIFFEKVRNGLDKDLAEEIEEDILPNLSEEYINSEFDYKYLFDQTLIHFRKRKLEILSQVIDNSLTNKVRSEEERLKDAEEFAEHFIPLTEIDDESLDLSKRENLKKIKKLFEQTNEPLIYFPKALGKLWNAHFVSGGFVSFLAPEKRGKTFLLLDIAMRAVRQGKKVAFFQAGDMNEAEQLKRIGVYLAKRSNLEFYCKTHYEPVVDCIHNQLNTCEREDRECDFGIFEDKDEESIRKTTYEELVNEFNDNEDYRPCHNCTDFTKNKWGVPFFKKIDEVEPLNGGLMIKLVKKFFVDKKRQFKLSTYANGTLSINDIMSVVDTWHHSEEFIPEIIIIDYADLLVPSIKTEFRHQQNQIWKDLRRLSQTKIKDTLPLVISPTQADAKSYETDTLSLSNFSEDKRKYAHVTAMYGLNQDKDGREKKLGIMRINEIIIREGAFESSKEVVLLQNLRRGRPYLRSY